MAEVTKPVPVSYEKLVYDALVGGAKHEGSRDSSDALLKLAATSKELGISPDDIVRAVAAIRQKGYPVISYSSRRTKEDGFRIPRTHSEYMAWREAMASDVRSLVALLRLMDAGAENKFGVKAPKSAEFIF